MKVSNKTFPPCAYLVWRTMDDDVPILQFQKPSRKDCLDYQALYTDKQVKMMLEEKK